MAALIGLGGVFGYIGVQVLVITLVTRRKFTSWGEWWRS